ncbi:MAG: fibronectin, partial [Actinobacteria bacterium]|nr:fibronectin [Actinomycetota bacterium]
MKPESGGSTSTIDPRAKVSNLAAITWRNQPTVVYGDYQGGQLKLATYRSKKWSIQTLKQGVKVGPISLCKSGSGTKERLHIVYANLETKDVIHGYQSANKWKFETVDGNGESVQDYREPIRTRTASDVSVSNACAITSNGLQIFYRDETQGILLAAIDTKNGWVYEIVDGDRKTDGRTTGDVAFHLSAVALGKTVYLLYDAVITVSANQTPTEGEVRLASRNSIYPEDWKFITVDGPDAGVAVAGYGTALSVVNKTLALSWLSA